MELKTVKINDILVTKIPGVQKEIDNVKGKELFDRAYPNVMLWARKNSGKTTTIFTILKKRADKDTILIFFVPTFYNDAGWLAIEKYFEKKGNQMQIYTSIKEDGIDQLESIYRALQEEAKEKAAKKDEPEEEERKLLRFDSESDSEDEDGKKKKKYVAPRFIFVFDDISDELRVPSLVSLIKKNRHFHSMCILSSQDLKDAMPATIKNIEYWMIWPGADEDRLRHIHKIASIWIPYSQFESLYKKATNAKYTFLYIDTVTRTFRRNFNEMIVLPG